MAQEDDLRGMARVMDLIRAASIVVLMLHCYWYGHGALAARGWALPLLDRLLLGLHRVSGVFGHIAWSKLLALTLLLVSCLGNRGVKSQRIAPGAVAATGAAGLALLMGNWWLLDLALPAGTRVALYAASLAAGYVALLTAGSWASRLMRGNLMDDVFNRENESFMQERRRMDNEYSVNLPTRFYYKGRWRRGWVNVVNPFRASMVLGTPGSGKSFAIVNSYIRQQVEKGFAMYIYDYKFPDLSEIAYNHLRRHRGGYPVQPTFYVINFDDPRRSHRCNPINPAMMSDISDAYESAYTIMLNLNRTWVQKQGDFFVESPINLLAAAIWFLKIHDGGRCCTFPHAIELVSQPYTRLFPVLAARRELAGYLSPFMSAWEGGAQDQLQGQIASLQIPVSRLNSPALYWVMTGDDFTLDINNPDEPKVLVVGSNPDRQNIYSAALGLYNSRIVKLINKKNQLKSSVIIDELPTIYFRGLDNLIATARSNRVAVCLGFQDFSQLTRDYGDKESRVIQNTVGNIFAGQVVGDTAESLSKRFGRVLQRRQSVSINRNDTSTSFSTQLDSLIPASKIASLTQGMFVGAVADNFGEEIEQKVFHARIEVDTDQLARQARDDRPIPIINPFLDGEGNDVMQQRIEANYQRVKDEVAALVEGELARIAEDPELQHLIREG